MNTQTLFAFFGVFLVSIVINSFILSFDWDNLYKAVMAVVFNLGVILIYVSLGGEE